MGGGSSSYKANNTRMKPYGVMLLLAFGASLLGVMVIHKLRERRIFNLVIKDKDNQLLSLQLLLQKEREYMKEMKKKSEEMKARIYSLRNQKMETERRMLEMHSTIDALKDERRIMESALEEKQNEIKLHTDKSMHREDEANSQMIALKEILKQKEAEIGDLKSQLQNPVKLWPVNTDDSSLAQPNSSVTGILADGAKTEGGGGQLHKSTDYSNEANESRNASTILITGENAARGIENRSESKIGIVDTEVPGEGWEKKLENSPEGRRNDSVGKETIGNSQENITIEGIVSTVADTKPADGEEHQTAGDNQLELKNYQQIKDQDQEKFRGGLKLERNTTTRRASYGVKEKHAKGKKWRMLARNRRLENIKHYEDNGAQGMMNRKFSHHNQDEVRDKEEVTTSKNEETYNKQTMRENNSPEETKTQDFSNAKLLELQNTENTVDLISKPISNDTDHLEKEGMSKRAQMSQTELELMNGNFATNASDTLNKAKRGSPDEVAQNESQNTNNTREDENEISEEIEAADLDHETDMASEDFYRESISDLEEDKEEYKEETEEPEF
ncbi:uncharacterized protein LOC126657467 [Mercurialis annua]|uniref:uncharacterized protein LOC126657467 n=1 Tax=Mercurialis annua TaxID=3986 RepID=UPI00215FC772|nr:uncharacterized protein LOC126657467 [Mercurialis annua]